MEFKKAIEEFSSWRGLNGVRESTVRGYDGILKVFAVVMMAKGMHSVEEVGFNDVMDYFKSMRSLDWNENTFCIKAFALKKFFQFYKKRGFKVVDPELIPVPKREQELPRVATHEEYKKVVDVIPKKGDHRHARNMAVINMLYDTGARVGEICSLNVEDLDLNDKKAIIKTEKARYKRKFRVIKWKPKTNLSVKKWLSYRERLLELLHRPEQNALFIRLTGNIGERLSIRSVEEALRRYSRKAELKRDGVPFILNPHSLRHLKGRDTIKNGGDLSDAANILGHTRVESAWIYAMLEGKDTEERHKKIFGW